MKRHHLEHLWNLLHLRYLRLIGPGIQTLDVETRNVWKTLPSVGLLTQLLCLRLKPMVQTVPDGIGTLMSLEELQIAYVEHEEAEPSLRQFVKELGSLRELRVLRAGVPPRLSADVRLQVDMVESLRNLEKMSAFHSETCSPHQHLQIQRRGKQPASFSHGNSDSCF